MAHPYYSRSIPYNVSDNRPYAIVNLLSVANPPASMPVTNCLVDTGADYLCLPRLQAQLAGILLPPTQNIKIFGVDGMPHDYPIAYDVDVIIEHWQVIVDVVFVPTLFDNSGNPLPFAPILGRTALLAAFECGFDDQGWHLV